MNQQQTAQDQQRLCRAWYGKRGGIRPTKKGLLFLQSQIEQNSIPKLYNHKFDAHVVSLHRHNAKVYQELTEHGFGAGGLVHYKKLDIIPVHHSIVLIAIKKDCELKTGISWIDIISNRRLRPSVIVRHVIMHLLNKYTPKTLPQVGKIFSRDYSTVCHSIKKVEAWIEMSKEERANSKNNYGPALVALESLISQEETTCQVR